MIDEGLRPKMGFKETDDLLPGRISGDTSELIEKGLLTAVGLLSVVTIAFGVYKGFATGHHEHVFMAFVTGMCLGQFAWIVRLYLQDVLQDRKLVYYCWITMVMVATTGLTYSTGWGIIPPTAAEQALQSCNIGDSNTCYNSAIGGSGCMKFASNLVAKPGVNQTRGWKCQAFNPGATLSWNILFPTSSGNVSTSMVSTAIGTCGLRADACLQSAIRNCSHSPRAAFQASAPTAPTIPVAVDNNDISQGSFTTVASSLRNNNAALDSPQSTTQATETTLDHALEAMDSSGVTTTTEPATTPN